MAPTVSSEQAVTFFFDDGLDLRSLGSMQGPDLWSPSCVINGWWCRLCVCHRPQPREMLRIVREATYGSKELMKGREIHDAPCRKGLLPVKSLKVGSYH